MRELFGKELLLEMKRDVERVCAQGDQNVSMRGWVRCNQATFARWITGSSTLPSAEAHQAVAG
jgi:hypothetical protein